MATLLFIFFMCMSCLPPWASSADPDPLQDFCVTDPSKSLTLFFNGLPCKPPSHVTPSDFKSDLLKNPGNTSNPLGIALTLASAANVGALNTQGLSLARIDYAKGGLVPPHVHPRASEILWVLEGSVRVGFVDTSNTLFSETLHSGELFVFPRGLLHFILNVGGGKATTLSALNSQNPGASLVANALFGATPGVADKVLEMAFQLSDAQVKHLKKAFG